MSNSEVLGRAREAATRRDKTLTPAGLRRALTIATVTLVLAGTGFYLAQNRDLMAGGPIAPVKVMWLGAMLLHLYIIPALLLLDRRLPRPARLWTGALLASTLARGVIELPLMYLFDAWHPWMGLTHNALTCALLLTAAWRLRDVALTAGGALGARIRLVSRHFVALTATFLCESGFALYMVLVVWRDGRVFYVPEDPRFRAILWVTGVALCALAAWTWLFVKRWLYDGDPRHGGVASVR